MPPKEEGFEQRLAAAVSLPASTQQFLYLYWLLANERLKRIAEDAAHLLPVNRRAEDVPTWMRKAQEHNEKTKNLQLVLRRVESYLGHKPKEVDARTLEDAMSLSAARWIRASIQNGDSDEEIAEWLRSFLSSSRKGKRGRPAGTMNCDGHALLALVLYDRNPDIWSFPKLADCLLGCRIHKEHAHDTSCTRDLTKAVERLRSFLAEIGYKPTET